MTTEHKLGCIYNSPDLVNSVDSYHGLDECDKNIDIGFKVWQKFHPWYCSLAPQDFMSTGWHKIRFYEHRLA